MIKEVKFGGLTCSPSDYECPDGDLAAVNGLVPEDGSLSPVAGPREVLRLEGGGKVLLTHEVAEGRNYIAWREGNALTWLREGGEEHEIATEIGADRELREIVAVGNTLVAAADDGMHYLLWKDGEYHYLGTHLPEVRISFGLRGELVRGDEFEVVFDDWPENGREFSDDDKTKVTNQVLAKVNKLIAEEVTEKGRFVFPFLVRWAYRLYDGTLTMQSAPILMPCTTGEGLLCRVLSMDPDGPDMKVELSAVVHQLDYAAVAEDVERLKLWGDIVKSVDLFVSKPIYTYDQNGKVERIEVDEDWEGGYSLCLLANARRPLEHLFDDYYVGWRLREAYENVANVTMTGSNAYRLVLPERDRATVREEIGDCHLFYLLKQIDIEALATVESALWNSAVAAREVISVGKDHLGSLVAREVLPDDWDSHDRLMAGYLYSYNGRLNATDMRKRLFEGYAPGSMLAYSNGWVMRGVASNHTERVKVSISIRQEGKEIVVESPVSVIGMDTQFLYLYYPNANAYKARIYTARGWGEVRLKPHPTLNGAYWQGEWDESRKPGEWNGDENRLDEETATEDRTVELANRIYTSEVGNPFAWPVTGINSVGTGRIMAVCSAAKALSQGQFGQFPLYAFATDGVWALELSDKGTYKAVQPFTRDVLVNRESIAQLDSSVLFATERGLMLVSGSDSICISDVLDYDRRFDVLNGLANMDLLVSLAAGVDPATMDYEPWKEFVKGCRMLYSYVRQMIIVWKPGKRYAYVYSLKSKAWGMVSAEIASNVPSYPEALAMLEDGRLVDYCGAAALESVEVGEGGPLGGVLVTRPLKLDMPDVVKTVRTVAVRGCFAKGHVKTVLYGSRDMKNWHLIGSSRDHFVRGVSGTGYKWFRVAVLCRLEKGESVYGCTMEYVPKMTNRVR